MPKTNNKHRPPHILLYPFPSAGHIIPLLDLADRLLSHGFTITVVAKATNLPMLEHFITTYPSLINPLVVPSQEIQSASQNDLLARMLFIRELHYPIILRWFRSHPSRPVAIISDFFLGWTNDLAADLDIPRILFSPSGAFSTAVTFSLWSNLPKQDDPEDFNSIATFPDVPNCPTYPWWQISQYYKRYKNGDQALEFFRNNWLTNKASWGILFNSFTQLEGPYIDHIKNVLGHNRVWAVGPLLSLEGPTERGGHSSMPGHQLMTWLDRQSNESVVYLCFGSRTVLTNEQRYALEGALEQSGVHFVWCERQPSEGFEQRVGNKGLVIKGWAPQVGILRHRAVRSFVTHCGWNSTLEGLASGVVMLAWPMGADQYTNAKLLVDHLKVGIRIGGGSENIPKAEELAKVLIESVSGASDERVRAKNLSQAAEGAMKGEALDEFINKLSEL